MLDLVLIHFSFPETEIVGDSNSLHEKFKPFKSVLATDTVKVGSTLARY